MAKQIHAGHTPVPESPTDWIGRESFERCRRKAPGLIARCARQKTLGVVADLDALSIQILSSAIFARYSFGSDRRHVEEMYQLLNQSVTALMAVCRVS